MIDIHTHILPGMDDGAGSEEEAVRMAMAAAGEGIHTIIATPHHHNGRYMNPGRLIHSSVTAFNELLRSRGIPVKVLPGQEVRMNRGLLDDLESGDTIGLHHTDYVLVELPFGTVPAYTEEMVHELCVMGRIPIIAHPERNAVLASSPRKLLRLIELGALAQVTSQSLTGGFGPKLQRLSLEWCRQGLIHFVSSDAHNLDNRSFHLAAAYGFLAGHSGPEIGERLKRNAERLLANERIPSPLPELGRTRKWWQFWQHTSL